jgi:hypothetical protein
MASSLKIIRPAAFEPLTLAEAKLHLRQTASDQDLHILGCIRTAREQVESFLNRSLLPQQLQWRSDSFPDLPNATLKFFVPTYSVESYLARAISLMSGPIYLPRPPVISIDEVAYIDQNGALQVLDPSLYLPDLDSEPARIAPAYSKPWPVTRAQQSAVSIKFTAGYKSTALSTIAANIVANAAPQAVTPASMIGILFGQTLMISEGLADQESVLITSVSATQFTAIFQNSHAGPGITVGLSTVKESFKNAMKLWISQLYQFREPVSEKQLNANPMGIDSLLWPDRCYEIPA